MSERDDEGVFIPADQAAQPPAKEGGAVERPIQFAALPGAIPPAKEAAVAPILRTEPPAAAIVSPGVHAEKIPFNPDAMPVTIQVALGSVALLALLNIAGFFLDLSLGQLNLPVLASVAMGGLLGLGFYYRNRLALQWGRVVSGISAVIMPVMTFFVVIGAVAAARGVIPIPFPFAGNPHAVPLLLATAVLFVISCALSWSLFVSLGCYSARRWFRLICPSCHFDQGQAVDFLFSQARCGHCGHQWTDEQITNPYRSGKVMPQSTISEQTYWKPIATCAALIVLNLVILIVEGLPALGNPLSFLAIWVASFILVGHVTGHRTVRFVGLWLSVLTAILIGLAAFFFLVQASGPRNPNFAAPTLLVAILHIASAILLWATYSSLLAFHQEKENEQFCPSCEADIPSRVGNEFPIVICRVCGVDLRPGTLPPVRVVMVADQPRA